MAACATNVARTLFFAFNFIFWILGIVVVAIGIYSRVEFKHESLDGLLDKSVITGAANLLIASGIIAAVVGFFGCCGAMKQVKWMLMVYCGLIALIFILEIAGGVYAYTNRDEVETKMEKKVSETVLISYGEPGEAGNATVKAVDWFQQKMKCCGVNAPSDWIESMWFKNYTTVTTFILTVNNTNITVKHSKVPDSCCKNESVGCGSKGVSDPNMFSKGCVEKGKAFVKDNVYLVGGVGVGIAVVQLLAIVFGACLICSFSDYEKPSGA